MIHKFRPISLVDCFYKIISKILTNRLAPLMNYSVDPAQTAFIQDRYILDNVLVANKIIHSVKSTNQQGIVLKVDFEKSYDKVSWDFIKELLLSRGFGVKWTTWIISSLQGSQTCINTNGTPTQYFYCKRGLRQRDPLSPFLFDLVTDALCQILNRGKSLHLIKGLGPQLEDGHRVWLISYMLMILFFF